MTISTPLGRVSLDLVDPCGQCLRHGEDVASLLHDGDTTDDLSGSVQVGNAPPEVVAHLQVADVLQMDGLPVRATSHDEELQIVEALRVDRPAKLILTVGDLDGPSARLLKRAPDRRDDLRERDASFGQQRRKQLDLILLFQAAHGTDLGNARNRLQRRLDQALVQEP